MWIAIGIIAGLAILFFLVTFVCFYLTFYSPKRKPLSEGEYDIPDGNVYQAIKDRIIEWTDEMRTLPSEELSIKSFDGLTLRGKYFECKRGAPIEILFHGYRGNSERDLCGAISRCFAIGRNALIVDQRGSGRSDGHVISFGINERRDCISWINFANEKFGKDSKLIITGISMGAATVIMAAGEELPENVVCVLADCGYSSNSDIIKKVLKDMHLPIYPTYPLIKIGAKIYGRFDLEETSPYEAVKKNRVPIIFIHGEDDDFVPCEMSKKLYEASKSPIKRLVTVPGAAHGLAFPTDEEKYLDELRIFEKEWNV